MPATMPGITYHSRIQLGEGFVRSLGKIDADRVRRQVLESYAEIFSRHGKDLRELQIPIQLFLYGIRYLIEKDERVLLDLVETERVLVREALGLDDTALDKS